MGIGSAELAHGLLALGLLLVAAHLVGYLFAVLRQPRVIGEICGGLLLGPTLFGALAPAAQGWVFDGPTTAQLVGFAYDVGLMLLMFVSGAEMRGMARREDRRTVAFIAVAGVVFPLLCGIAVFRLIDVEPLLGTADSRAALLVVFALAIAVTSIPVISRIFLDLGVMNTRFARIVISVAVIEDVVVYVLLAVALGMVSQEADVDLGVTALLGLEQGGSAALAAHVLATALLFVVMLTVIARIFRWGARRFTEEKRELLLSYHLVFLLAATLATLALGLAPLFGAFLAGVAVSSAPGAAAAQARESIKDASLAAFVPVYFAVVGLNLDLVNRFDPVFFVGFALFACLAKSLSVLVGARLAGEGRIGARNLAVATNARGGPGIVLASVSLSAGIVSEEFYASLVMLAVITSLAAGTWLGHVVRSGQPLREEQDPAVVRWVPRRLHSVSDE